MLLRMGLLLRLGPNVITDGTFITLGSTYYTCAFYSFHSREQHLYQFMGTKESVYIRKEINSQRTGLEQQHGRRFIVLEHQYGRRDVM